MACSDMCPACPPNRQHHGRFCPKLCALRKKESFWVERAYVKYKDGYNEPTPGVEGWVRLEFRKGACGDGEGACGKEEGASGDRAVTCDVIRTVSQPSNASITPSLPISAASTPPLSRSPLATSVASTEGPKTPEMPSGSTVGVVEYRKPARLPSLILGNSAILNTLPTAHQVPPSQPRRLHNSIEPTDTAASPKLSAYHQKIDHRRSSFAETYIQSRSRSPSPEPDRERTYRDRRDVWSVPARQETHPKPNVQPSIPLLFSDPSFIAVIKSEADNILSTAFSVNAAHQRAPVDKIIMAVLWASDAMIRHGAGGRKYQPSESIKRYLTDLKRDFPLLMSNQHVGMEALDPAREETLNGINTYYGSTEAASKPRWELQESVSKLIGLNQHLIEGTQTSQRRPWDQRDFQFNRQPNHQLDYQLNRIPNHQSNFKPNFKPTYQPKYQRDYQQGHNQNEHKANPLGQPFQYRQQGTFRKPFPIDPNRNHWDYCNDQSIALSYDDPSPNHQHAHNPHIPRAPRAPRHHYQDPYRRTPQRYTPYRYTQQPGNRFESGAWQQPGPRMDTRAWQHRGAKPRVGPQATPPVRRPEAVEVTQVAEKTERTNTADSGDIFSALESKLQDGSWGGYEISEECWDDLFKGDV